MSSIKPVNFEVEIPETEPDGYARLTWSYQETEPYGPPSTGYKQVISAYSLGQNSTSNSRKAEINSDQDGEHVFTDLQPGTLYRFQVCFVASGLNECTNEIIKTTRGVAPPPPNPQPEPLQKPVITSVVSFPKYIDKHPKIEVRWSGIEDSTFIDYYWEWLSSPYIGNSLYRRKETQTPLAIIEGESIKADSIVDFEVLLVQNPTFFSRKYSELTRTSVRTSPVLKSIREFLNGQSANDGLGKTLRKFGHDPKSVINVLRF